MHWLDPCGGEDRCTFVVPVSKGSSASAFRGIGNALRLVILIRLGPTGEERPAIEAAGFMLSWDVDANEGSGDMKSGWLMVGDGRRFVGDGKLKSLEPLGEKGGFREGLDNELLWVGS